MSDAPPRNNIIRGFALVCVAVTTAYVMFMGYRLNEVLAGPDWCRRALGAEKVSATDGAIKGLDACVGLLTIQLRSLATNSHILFGVIALCLAVLIVIVIAGGKLDFEANKDGARGSIGPAADAKAETLADAGDALTSKAAEIKDGAA